MTKNKIKPALKWTCPICKDGVKKYVEGKNDKVFCLICGSELV